jgi:chromosome segregation ATPase
MKKILLASMIALAFVSCNTKELETENAALKAEMDSLKMQVEMDRTVGQQLANISVLMDSIDKDRNALRVNLETGINPEDYEARMKGIQQYLRDAKKKISDLDKTGSSYSALIKKLQRELTTKNSEITALQQTVASYKEENNGLISKVNLQTIEIDEKNEMIIIKQQELALIEAKVQELMVQAEVSEADAYMARGEAIQLAATRTKLAPKKKKQTYNEALELYKKSLALGNNEAKEKIAALEEIMK